jgi:hypothetical protein
MTNNINVLPVRYNTIYDSPKKKRTFTSFQTKKNTYGIVKYCPTMN